MKFLQWLHTIFFGNDEIAVEESAQARQEAALLRDAERCGCAGEVDRLLKRGRLEEARMLIADKVPASKDYVR